MITLPIISRIIGPEKYGVVNYAYAFVGYFILFINAGFDFYGTRKILEYKGDKQKTNDLFSRITIAKTYLLIISLIIFYASLFFIPQLRQEKLVSIFTFLLCIGWVINPSWLYNGMQDSRKYAFFSFISQLLFSISVIIIIRQRSDYIYHPLVTGLAHVLVSGISMLYATRKYSLRFHYINWQKIKQTLRENKHLSLIWWFTNQSASTNIIIVGFFLSTLNVGIYSAAIRLIVIIQTIISMPLNTVLFPYIGEAFVSSYEEGLVRVNKTFPYLLLISGTIALGTYAFAKPVVLVFYGHQFTDAILMLKIASMVLFFSTINSAFGQQILLHLKLESVYLRFIITGFCVNIGLLFFLINTSGSIGAALAWPLSEIVLFACYISYFKTKGIKVFRPTYYRPKLMYYNISSIFKLKPQKQ
jgi:O-antigen/teichoic acid export membrane protein